MGDSFYLIDPEEEEDNEDTEDNADSDVEDVFQRKPQYYQATRHYRKRPRIRSPSEKADVFESAEEEMSFGEEEQVFNSGEEGAVDSEEEELSFVDEADGAEPGLGRLRTLSDWTRWNGEPPECSK